jgi:threonine/homoserine/homoserine lactone efflux protein
VTQGVGAIFVGIFLAAYLAGLPTTAVLHSDPVVRTSLAVIGVVFLLLIFSNVILAALVKRQ